MAVFNREEFLFIASDQQEGVVGPRTEDENRQNPRNRTIRGDVEKVCDISPNLECHSVGSPHNKKRNNPENRASIGDQQKENHNQHGGEQKGEICARKDAGKVNLEPFGTGHICANSVGGVFRDERPDLGDALSLLINIVNFIHGDGEDAGRVVFRDGRRRNKQFPHHLHIAELGEELVDASCRHLNHRIKLTLEPDDVVIGELTGGLRQDHHRRSALGTRHLSQCLLHQNDFGVIGKARVGTDVSFLGSKHRERQHGKNQPDKERDP